MSINQHLPVGERINSCLIGANAYHVTSSKADFATAPLEERCDAIRQRDGYHHMRIRTTLDKSELWMVPFASSPKCLENLQDAVEEVLGKWWGTPGFQFPFDLVEEETADKAVTAYADPEKEESAVVFDSEKVHGTCTAYVVRPFDGRKTKPFRLFLPTTKHDRWALAKNLFSRVAQLHEMGLSSNGISREQLRVNEKTLEFELRLNHTLRLIHARNPEKMQHQGFGAIPIKTAKERMKHSPITCVQRDIYSCAVWAFYLILYTHPFVGNSFTALSREDYLNRYLYSPSYIMDPRGNNGLGNQPFDHEVENQWEKTAPELKKLFDGMFLEVSHPDLSWDDDAPWWKIESWLSALEADAKRNNNENGYSKYDFENYLYHLV